MLKRLKISNIALIKEIEMEFNDGLNILFGETGAGKSIIVDSINFLLGQRADKSLIRKKEPYSRVEGVFIETDNTKLENALKKYGIDFDGVLIISRIMNRDIARSDTRINGVMSTISMLREVTSCVCDVCNQNEDQYLLITKNQLEILDGFCNSTGLLNEYTNELNNYHNIIEKLKTFGGSDEERNKEIDFLEFQINEILEAELKDNEDEILQEQVKKLSNIEKISNALEIVREYFENNQGIMPSLNSAIKEIVNISRFDNKLNDMITRLNSCKLEFEDIGYELNEYYKNLEYNPQEFYRLDARLDLIKKLQRKYGKTIKDIKLYLDRLQTRLDELNNSLEEIQKLNQLKTESLDKLYKTGKKLSAKRQKNALILEKKIINELKDLNMNNTQFKISFSPEPDRENIEKHLHSNGFDEIEFLFSANVGQPLLPLTKIISGGEMSRFMLATKTVFAKVDSIPSLIFDEIDTGISGKTSIEVAKKMALISRTHQVIVITHSFQVIAMADTAIYVNKKQVNDETITIANTLSEEQITDSISQLLGSEETLDTARHQAAELRIWSNKFKDGI